MDTEIAHDGQHQPAVIDDTPEYIATQLAQAKREKPPESDDTGKIAAIGGIRKVQRVITDAEAEILSELRRDVAAAQKALERTQDIIMRRHKMKFGEIIAPDHRILTPEEARAEDLITDEDLMQIMQARSQAQGQG